VAAFLAVATNESVPARLVTRTPTEKEPLGATVFAVRWSTVAPLSAIFTIHVWPTRFESTSKLGLDDSAARAELELPVGRAAACSGTDDVTALGEHRGGHQGADSGGGGAGEGSSTETEGGHDGLLGGGGGE
jgi:hypothetical protein